VGYASEPEYTLMKLLLGAFLCSVSAFRQTAPQRSEELCATLQQTASEKGRAFYKDVPSVGACRMNIDTGYDLFVTYTDQTLDLGLRVDAALLRDADAFWLRLSALDNLAHPALGTKQQAIFDGLNRLVKKLAQQQLAHGITKDILYDRAQKATLAAGTPVDAPVLVLMASAKVRDIDEMKRSMERRATGEIPSWRKILSMSLLAFGAGAQGYANAYRPPQQTFPTFSSPRTCYTNFIGKTAFTNCY
jgi:hypothetical protein